MVPERYEKHIAGERKPKQLQNRGERDKDGEARDAQRGGKERRREQTKTASMQKK